MQLQLQYQIINNCESLVIHNRGLDSVFALCIGLHMYYICHNKPWEISTLLRFSAALTFEIKLLCNY